jgi:hypothetical protein
MAVRFLGRREWELSRPGHLDESTAHDFLLFGRKRIQAGGQLAEYLARSR